MLYPRCESSVLDRYDVRCKTATEHRKQLLYVRNAGRLSPIRLPQNTVLVKLDQVTGGCLGLKHANNGS
jgi:hypothetical protein